MAAVEFVNAKYTETLSAGSILLSVEPSTLTVSFNTDGGAPVPAAQNVAYGGKVTQPTNAPQKAGCEFGGWFEEAACTNQWDFATDTVTSDTTLYAKLTPRRYYWAVYGTTLSIQSTAPAGAEVSGSFLATDVFSAGAPWLPYCGSVTRAQVIGDVKPISTTRWFDNSSIQMPALLTVDLSGLNSAQLTEARAMFYNCTNIETLDLGGVSADSAACDAMLSGLNLLSELTVSESVALKICAGQAGLSDPNPQLMAGTDGLWAHETGNGVVAGGRESFTAAGTYFAKVYKVLLSPNGGTGEEKVIFRSIGQPVSGTVALPTNAYTRAGYSANGWNTAADATGTPLAAGDTLDIEAFSFSNYSHYIYAAWSANTYTLTLNNHAGSAQPATMTATYGQLLQALESVPVRAGFEFAGYYEAADGGGVRYYDEQGQFVLDRPWQTEAGATLHAFWRERYYWRIDGAQLILSRTEDPDATGTHGSFYSTDVYASAADVPWLKNAYSTAVTEVVIADDLSPVSTAHWFDNSDGYMPVVRNIDMAKLPLVSITDAGLSQMLSGLNLETFTIGAVGTGKLAAAGLADPTVPDAESGWVWYDAANQVAEAYSVRNITKAGVYHAVAYRIKLHNNYGEGSSATTIRFFDGGLAAVALDGLEPNRRGYTLNSWNTKADGAGTSYALDDTLQINELAFSAHTFELYAQWTAKSYTVTLDKNGGTGGADSFSVAFHDAIPASVSVPAKPGATFLGYYAGSTLYYGTNGRVDASCPDKAAYTSEAARLTARWEQNCYWAVSGNTLTISAQSIPGAPEGSSGSFLSTAAFESYETVPWRDHAGSITAVTVQNSVAPTSTAYWFYGFSRLTEVDLAGLDTGIVNTAKYMFASCTSLQTLDLSGVSLAGCSAANCSNMLFGLTALREITLSASVAGRCGAAGLNDPSDAYIPGADGYWTVQTAQAVVARRASEINAAGRYIALPYRIVLRANGGDGTQRTVARYMDAPEPGTSVTLPANDFTRTGHAFQNWNLDTSGAGTGYPVNATLSVSELRFDADTHIAGLYAQWELSAEKHQITLHMQGGTGGTASITAAYGEELPDITPPAKPGETFQGYFSSHNVPCAQTEQLRYYNADGTPSRETSDFDADGHLYAIWGTPLYWGMDGSTLVFSNSETGYETGGSFLSSDVFSSAAERPWGNRGVTAVRFGTGADDIIRPKSTAYWFDGMTALSGISFAGLNSAETWNMSHMFAGCTGLTDMDMAALDTSAATDLSGLFSGCTRLTSLALFGMNTSNALDISDMFKNASQLTSLDLRSFDLSHVNNADNMLAGLSGLERIVISESVAAQITAGSTGLAAPAGSIAGSDGHWYDASASRVEALPNTAGMYYAVAYRLSFDPNDTGAQGSMPTVGFIPRIVDAKLLPANSFTREGYRFVRWDTQADGLGRSYLDKDEAQIGDLFTDEAVTATLYAVWAPNSYTVHFENNARDASGAMSDQSFTYDAAFAPLAANAFTRPQYEFASWNTKPDGSGTAYEDGAPVSNLTASGSITLYAQWSAPTFAVAFDLNYAGSVALPGQSVLLNGLVTVPAQPGRVGYTFSGWYTEAACATAWAFDTPVTQDITLYAKWTAHRYTVTFNANGDDIAGTMAPQEFVYAAEQALSANTFSRMHYDFAGWALSAGGVKQYNNQQPVSTLTAVDGGSVTLYAVWRPTQYSVSYVLNGGTNSSDNPAAYTYFSSRIDFEDPRKTGYTFGGWYTESIFATQKSSIPAGSTGNVTVYALWTANSYTVAFNSNGGTGDMQSQPFTYGLPQALPENSFTREGYTFSGWARSADGSKEYADKQSVNNLTATAGEEVTLYAVWTANNYTVVFNSNGGTGSMADQSFAYGTAQSLSPNTFEKDGYHFSGWATRAGGAKAYDDEQAVKDLTTTGSLNLYAVWAGNSYTVTLNKNAEDATAGTTSVSAAFGSAMPVPAAPPTRTGYSFAGYYDDAAGTGSMYYNAALASQRTYDKTSDTILYAKWERLAYTVTFHANGYGTAPEAAAVYHGDTLVLPTPPQATGYTFGGWYTDSGCTALFSEDEPVTQSITLYAKWTVKNYNVELYADEGAAAPYLSVSVTYGGAMPSIANDLPVKEHYDLLGFWTDGSPTVQYYNANGLGRRNYDIGADSSMYARWQATRYAITYYLNGGTNSVSNPSIYTYFDSVTLYDPARTGYTFAGWYTEAAFATRMSGIPEGSTGQVNLYAKWIPNSYTVAFSKNAEDAAGMAMEAMRFTYDAAQPLSRNTFTRPGYSFAGWTRTADGSGTPYADGQSVSNLSSAANAAVTLYAKWTPNQYTVHFDANGGAGAQMDDEVYTYGESGFIPSCTYTKPGYHVSWNTAADGSGTSYQGGLYHNSTLTTEANGTVTLYAKWSPITYSVKFNGNGGTGSPTYQAHTYDASLALTQNAFTRAGYTFAGWTGNADGSGAQYADKAEVTNLAIVQNAVIDLYAQWTPNSYTVAFDANGGSGSMAPQSFTYGTAQSLPLNAFTKAGYTFAGWTRNADGSGMQYTDEQSVSNLSTAANGEITLFAKWTRTVYHITYQVLSTNGEPLTGWTTPGGSNPSSYTIESAAQTIYGAALEGYTVGGWYRTRSFTGDQVTSLPAGSCGDITLYAQALSQSYTVSFDTQGRGAAPADQSVATGGHVTEPAAPQAAYHTFNGWYKEADCSNAWNFADDTVSRNETLYAMWTVTQSATLTYYDQPVNRKNNADMLLEAVSGYAGFFGAYDPANYGLNTADVTSFYNYGNVRRFIADAAWDWTPWQRVLASAEYAGIDSPEQLIALAEQLIGGIEASFVFPALPDNDDSYFVGWTCDDGATVYYAGQPLPPELVYGGEDVTFTPVYSETRPTATVGATVSEGEHTGESFSYCTITGGSYTNCAFDGCTIAGGTFDYPCSLSGCVVTGGQVDAQIAEQIPAAIQSGAIVIDLDKYQVIQNGAYSQVVPRYIAVSFNSMLPEVASPESQTVGYNSVLAAPAFTDSAQLAAAMLGLSAEDVTWYTDREYTTQWDFTAPVTADMILYAKWPYSHIGEALGDPGATYTGMTFSRCTISAGTYTNCNFADCAVTGGSFNSDGSSGVLRVFLDCEVSGGVFDGYVFANSSLSGGTFLTSAQFTNCSIALGSYHMNGTALNAISMDNATSFLFFNTMHQRMSVAGYDENTMLYTLTVSMQPLVTFMSGDAVYQTQYIVITDYSPDAAGAAEAPEPPVRENFTFGGWYTDPDCTDGNEWSFETGTTNADITLYAKWASDAPHNSLQLNP